MEEVAFSPRVVVLLTASVIASTLVWTNAISRIAHGRDVIPATPHREVPWRGIHVGLAFLVYLILPQCAFLAARWRFGITDLEKGIERSDVFVFVLAAQTMLFLVGLGMIVTFLRIDLKATAADLGWSVPDIGKDIVLGITAFLAIAPPVFALQYLLLLVYRQLYEDQGLHPIIEKVLDQPTGPILIWSTISAVLVAPLIEEFLFRVVLQGWLEKVIRGAQQAILMMQDSEGASGMPSNDEGSRNPYAAPATVQAEATKDRFLPAPILISSMVFAVFHLGHGPAPIPLFLLALGLGYLYQRTHRIGPSLVVHFLLNGTTVLNLWFASA